MNRCPAPESVRTIAIGDFLIYSGPNIARMGIPYILLTFNDIRGKVSSEGFAMVPGRLFVPAYKYNVAGQSAPEGQIEVLSPATETFSGACHHLLSIETEMAPEERDLFPSFLSFTDAERAELYFQEEYLSPLQEIGDLTESEGFRRYIDDVMVHLMSAG